MRLIVPSSCRLRLWLILAALVLIGAACGAPERVATQAPPTVAAPTRATPAPRPTVTPTVRATPRPALAPPSGMRTISADQLPREARATLDLIERGGPYPYRQDGQTFQNRERLLPDKAEGYYREYTVETPGSPDRGARRIVTGRGGEVYYTSDHYESFRWVTFP